MPAVRALRSSTPVGVVAMLLLLGGGRGQAAPKDPASGEVTGFGVEISGDGREVDSAWETCTGGGITVVDPTSGQRAVEPLTLRGPLTAERKNLNARAEVLENGAGHFRVEVEGCPEASAAALGASIDDLSIDVRELTTGADWDYRVYGPGDAHYGSATFRCRVGKDSKELYTWWLDSSRGKNIRKSISVICLKRDGTEERRFLLHDCFPTAYAPFEFSPAQGATERLTVKIGRVELVTRSGRKALCQWINDTVGGRAWKQSVTVKEITKDGGAGKSYEYLDCFPIRYVFPSFSATGSGPLMEEVTVKPIRVELK